MTEKTTLWITGGIILLSFAVLLIAGERAVRTPSDGLWAVSFSDPESREFSFDVKNFAGPDAHFRWSLLQEGRKEEEEIVSGASDVVSKASLRISPETGKLSGKVIIRVTDEAGVTRELYKILP